MKTRGYLYLIGFAVFLMIIGLACNGGATPTAAPVAPVAPANTNSGSTNSNTNTANDNTNSNANTNSSSAIVTFTDQNKFYQIDVPGDWKHKSDSGTHYYIDQFKAPDGNALVENITYNDGTPFTGSQNGQFALQLLHQFYSSTGKEGDIHVSEDSIQKDGSERLVWTSSGGGYSGLSYFEVRDKLNFLMFTVEWSNNYKDTYLDTLNKVIASYMIP